MPSAQSMRSNPPLPRVGCPSPLYCNLDGKEASIALFSGTCMRNTADCGQFGKKCCISTEGGSQVTECKGGYCANPPDYKEVDSNGKPKEAPFADRVCTRCPDIPKDWNAKMDLQYKVPGIYACF